MNEVLSTVRKGGKTKLVSEFNSKNIIKKYENENSVDVSRFFNGLEQIKLIECLSTGYRFYHPESIIADGAFYEDLAQKREHYYSRRWEHIEALKFINVKDKVLEVGSGFGSFLSLLRENGVTDISGLELSNLAVDKCVELNLDVRAKLIEEINTDNKYDAICSFQVLEHIYDVRSFLEAAINLLKPGGKLIIGVPNNNPYLHIIDKYHTLNLPPHHAGLWSRKSLKKLSNFYNLNVVKIKTEPLNTSYAYFVDFYLKNSKNRFNRTLLKVLNKHLPKITKKILNNFVEGRNVMAVYTKK